MTAARHLLIAAGGTGGHMFPAQALAEAMLAEGWRVTLSTDERGARYSGGFPHQVVRRRVASATTARGGLGAKLGVPFVIGGGVGAAVAAFLRDRPSVVVGFGGYPAIPAMAAATLLGLPRMIHEQNGVLGRVNRLFAARVDRVGCGVWPTDLPKGVEGVHVGNPVRAAIREKAGAAYVAPGPGPNRVLVLGGSQGARILSDVVPRALAELPEHLRKVLVVSHQARPEDAAQARETYAAAGIAADVARFFDDIPERMAAAQLMIARAGASTVAEIGVIGRPSVLIPFAAATADHQTANARALAEKGAAVVVSETGLAPDRLAVEVEAILADPERARGMAAGALALGRPDATERLKALVEELAEKTTRRKDVA